MEMPTKIVLKNSTNRSLNDRFSEIAAKVRQGQQQVQRQHVKVRMASLNMAVSAKNREAIKMANRQIVTDHTSQIRHEIENKPSIRDRLGPISAKARLGPAGRGWNQTPFRGARGGYFNGRQYYQQGPWRRVARFPVYYPAVAYPNRGGFYRRGPFRGHRGQGFRGYGVSPMVRDQGRELGNYRHF